MEVYEIVHVVAANSNNNNAYFDMLFPNSILEHLQERKRLNIHQNGDNLKIRIRMMTEKKVWICLYVSKQSKLAQSN